MCPEHTHHCIGNPCSKPTTDTDQCRNQCRILEPRFHNKQTSDKSKKYTSSLSRRNLLFQKKERKNDCKKRRQFIQNRSICYQKMVDRIKITENSKCSKCTTKEKRSPVLFLNSWYHMLSGQNDRRKNSCYQVTKKALLHR